MKKHVSTALFCVLCCAAAQAADTYAVDPNHTSATFTFNHLGFSNFHGKLPKASGSIVLDRAQKTGTADIVFDVKAIATGVPKFDDHLRSNEFFDAEKHPTATFKATKIGFKGDAPSTLAGDLTIKGQTKPVTLEVTSFKCGDHPMMKVPACGANAKATIRRSDFGLGLYVPAVSDEITLDVEVEAMKK